MAPLSLRDRRGLRGLRLAVAGAVLGALAVSVAPVATVADASPGVSCTFNGKPGPAPITGVVAGTTTLAITCHGTSGLGLAAVMASPLGGIVIAPESATNEADVSSLTAFTQSPPGTYTATFKVPATFHATDPKAVCPPSAGQFDAGLVGCPVAVINTANLTPFPGQEAILVTKTQTKPPLSPTLAAAGNVVTPGEHLTFGDATGACTDDPSAASQCWWGDALAASTTGSGSSATLTVTLDGHSVPGATAAIAGPGSGGLATYNGTTLVPQTLSGSITLPSGLADGTHRLTVTQTNVTPFRGNKAATAGSPITASTTLVVGAYSKPLVTAVSPTSGTSAGGTPVTITGSGLTGATAVHFGSSAARFTVASATSISAVAPKGAGAVDVTVTTSKGTSLLSDADRYVYSAPSAPVVTAVDPPSGTQDGGTLVEVTGSGFLHATAVHFGANPATSFHVLNDRLLVAQSPASSGTVNVTVTTALGTSPRSHADSYSYLPGRPGAPRVTGLSPALGKGGTTVTISGRALTGATRVDFGATPATHFTVRSDTAILATAPAGTVTGSPVDVVVRTPSGTSATSPPDQFTYVHAPSVSGVSPADGAPAGGYTVTISGSGFTGATGVRFGTATATSFTVEGDSTIDATVPAGHGAVDVRVATPAGTSATSAADLFTYGAAAVAGLSPSAGSPIGGYQTTISGTGFTGATAVEFGSVAATNVSVESDDEITCTVPAGTGTVDVRVVTPAGTSATSSADEFAYVGQPTVTGVSPSEGPTGGGNLVTVAGTSLTDATAVDFGGVAATDVTVLSDTSLTAVAPAGSSLVDVTVSVPSGTSTTNPNDEYTYVAAPVVSGLDPPNGPNFGGTTVDISGSGFTTASTVDFGPGNPVGFTVNSDSSITVTSPSSPGGAGPVDVTVTNAGGTSATGSADVFDYVLFPSVTSVSPAAGPLDGGTTVLVSGNGFTPSSTVDFGTAAGTNVVVESADLIQATSPSGSGTVDVTVTNGSDTSQTNPGDQFAYEDVPTVSSVSPALGPVSGGTEVTITGTNLLAASAVEFGGQQAAFFSVGSASSVTAEAPSSVAAGSVDVSIVTASGTSATSTADQFTYVAAPTLSSLTPPAGPVSGGTGVTITGTGFTDASAVTFGGIPAASFTVESDSSIDAVAPAQTTPAPFSTTVQVTTVGGTAGDGTAGDTFDYAAVVPDISAVSPATNTTAGDSLVTISGTGFTSDATVSFGADGAGGSVTLSSPTSLTVNSPPGAAGTVDLRVTTSGGTSPVSAADHYTYVAVTPTLTITPQRGATSGSTVTITGTGFPTGNWNVNDSGVILVQADPLAAFLTGFSALADLDISATATPTVDNNGDFTTTFTLADPFTPISDPNGACKPLQYQIDMGLVGCAIAALSINPVTILGSLADVPVIYSGTTPDPPTLRLSETTVKPGSAIHFTGTGWWGSYPGGGATAKICGIGGNPRRCSSTTGSGTVAPVTYSGSGGSLHGATVSGAISVAAGLAGCRTCFLTVTQPNLTPLPGKVTAAVALTILPAKHSSPRPARAVPARWTAAWVRRSLLS